MGNFKFWSAVVTSLLLGVVGFVLASLLPLPTPFTVDRTKFVYVSLGILLGILIYGKVISWIVRTTSRLFRQLMTRIAIEVINQLTHLTSATGIPFFSGSSSGMSSKELRRGNPIIIDTSAFIDGRVLDIIKSGFLSGILLVPDFVLRELQQVADSKDEIKRSRGRRGFEIVEEIKKIEGVKMEVWDKTVSGKVVDDKLVRLAKMVRGKILTCDFNLNKVASLSKVTVLNINDLSHALQQLPVPGEKITVKLIHPGKDNSQGIGYLSDGTMIVVKDGAPLVGDTAEVEINKVLQGSAGRMIFGRLV